MIRPIRLPWLTRQTQLILNSYMAATGENLIPRQYSRRYGPDDEALYLLQDADFAVLSDGTEPDPIFTYANQFALRLWETDFKRITSMPSRNSAEPGDAQEDREKLFEEMRRKGFFAYEHGGVRISTTGKRFEIMNGAVWDLKDEEGNWRGRAAMFKNFKHI